MEPGQRLVRVSLIKNDSGAVHLNNSSRSVCMDGCGPGYGCCCSVSSKNAF